MDGIRGRYQRIGIASKLLAVRSILGIDALIDMVRTSINVTGNCLACAVMARWEGEPPADSDYAA